MTADDPTPLPPEWTAAWLHAPESKEPLTGLFDPLDPPNKNHPPKLASLGYLENPWQLGLQYLKAADTLVDAWLESDDDGYALPILQNYRHGIELILKGNCLAVADAVRKTLTLGMGRNTIPDDLDERIGSTHSIAQLANLLNRLFDGLSEGTGDEIPAPIRHVLDHLHSWDTRGMAFRYGTHKINGSWVPIRPEHMRIDLSAGVVRLARAAYLLDWHFGRYIDYYDDLLDQVEPERGAEED